MISLGLSSVINLSIPYPRPSILCAWKAGTSFGYSIERDPLWRWVRIQMFRGQVRADLIRRYRPFFSNFQSVNHPLFQNGGHYQ